MTNYTLESNADYLKRHTSLFQGSLRGIERECLRVTPKAILATTVHPEGVGSALTHPLITTDFSEALLEFITAPHASIDAMLEQLEQIHCFTAQYIDDELFWSSSMPCQLPEDSKIPIAQYGLSNVGKMKSVYRKGLSNRYGRSMQTVSGIHFNFSIPAAVWSELRWKEHSFLSLQDYTTDGYFRLIRNFKRWYWLLIYLFGSAPAVSQSFLQGKEHNLQPLENIPETSGFIYGTSLRLGNLGYQSSVQDKLNINYNDLQGYVSQLLEALNQPYKGYETINVDKQWQQLSTAILQIENEFYSVIRPKQTARSGETQLKALWNRGVEYIEVRCMDINPFEPLGINASQVAFLETFLLTCMLEDSPAMTAQESQLTLENQKAVVESGRKPGLMLKQIDTKTDSISNLSLTQWSKQLFAKMQIAAQLLDNSYVTQRYQQGIKRYEPMLEDPDKTLSGQIIQSMQREQSSHLQWVSRQSDYFTQQFKSTALDADIKKHFEVLTAKSREEQNILEQNNTVEFSHFIEDYYQQYDLANFQ